MFKPLTLVLIALSVMSSFAADAAERPELSDELPKWVKKSMKKESRRKKKLRPVSIANDTIEVQVRGKLREAPTETDPGVWYLQTDIGAEVDANCWIITEPRYLYNMLISTADNLLEVTAESYEGAKIGAKEIFFTDVGYLDKTPYGILERLYLIESAEGSLIGLQKARVAQQRDVTFVCEHNELGYVDTFDKLFVNLVTKAKINLPYDPPYYAEHQMLMLGGAPVGTAQITMTLDVDGDTQIYMETGLLMALGDEITTMDQSLVEYSYPDGTLINALTTEADSEQQTRELSLQRTESGSWQVAGFEKGKEVSYDLGPNDDMRSVLGQMFMVKAAVAKPEPEDLSIRVWYPDVDVASFTTSKLAFGERTNLGISAVNTLGPVTLMPIFDSTGSTVSSAQDMGGIILSTKRVHLEGAVRSATMD